MINVISVVGARPNYMKVAPIHRAFQKHSSKVNHLICHTGQHYDVNMSDVFFNQLELPQPDFYLGVGSASHAIQTAKIMIEFEKVLLEQNPHLVLVVGDVNSTIACSLVAVKLGIKVAHVEAGLRSFDRTMPEEINRLLTDQISDYLFVTEKSGIENLRREGISHEKIFFVGNTMIDSLTYYMNKIDSAHTYEAFGLKPFEYIVVTLHRPSNVDNPENLKRIFQQFEIIAQKYKIIFPIHPRTKKIIEVNGIDYNYSNILLVDPLGYIEFVNLVKNSLVVLTDSGGIQEETTYLKIPCLTLRNNTERPITVELGTNRLIGIAYEKIASEVFSAINNPKNYSKIPPLWDGRASERIAETIVEKITN